MDILTDTAGVERKKENIKMFLSKKGEWLSVLKDFENLKNNILFREVCDTDQMKILDKNTAITLLCNYGQRIRKNTETLAFPAAVKSRSQGLSRGNGRRYL